MDTEQNTTMDGQNTAIFFFFFALTLHNYLSSTARITTSMVKRIWEKCKYHEERIIYSARMSECAMYAQESTTPHWHLGGRTRKLCCTHNSNLVRSGEGGADPPGARWCTEHKGLILECSLDLERAWCFPLMTGCSVVRGVGSPLLERHGSRPLKHQGQKETVQLLAPGTPSRAPLHQRTLQILAAGPGLIFQSY